MEKAFAPTERDGCMERLAEAHRHLGGARSASRDTEPEGMEPKSRYAVAMGAEAAAQDDGGGSCVATEMEAVREVEMDVQFERSRYY